MSTSSKGRFAEKQSSQVGGESGQRRGAPKFTTKKSSWTSVIMVDSGDEQQNARPQKSKNKFGYTGL
jgi:hypothetical protein